MLPTTFNEEYYNISTPFEFTTPLYFINEKGDIILTSSNILKDTRYSFNNVINIKEDPNNVNLIIDTVNVITTNDTFSSFLPLSIGFSGSKPVVDFSDPTQSTIEKYRFVLKENIGVLTQKYDNDGRLYTYTPTNNELINIYNHQSDHLGLGVWVNYNSATIRYTVFLTKRQYKDDFYSSPISLDSQIIPNTSEVANIPTISNYTFLRMEGNEVQTFGLVDYFGVGNIHLVGLAGGITVAESINNTSPNYNDITLEPAIYGDGTNSIVLVDFRALAYSNTNIYVISGTSLTIYENIINLGQAPNRIKQTFPTSTVVGGFNQNNIVDMVLDTYFFNEELFAIESTGDIYNISILPNDTHSYSLFHSTGLNNVFRIFKGKISKLINTFIIVTKVRVGLINTYTFYYLKEQRLIQILIIDYTTIDNTYDLPIKDVGINGIHFSNLSNNYIINTCTGEVVIEPFTNFIKSLPFESISGNVGGFGMNSKYAYNLILSQRVRTGLSMYYRDNLRPNSRLVYKYTFHYSERNYPFTKNSSIFLDIFNQGIKDLEIIKLEMSFRIRYSKSNSRFLKMEENEEELNRKFTKTTRAQDSAERALGLVGSDFDVSSFLKIYDNT